MNALTKLSSKGQVVIPKEIRDALRLSPGETLSVSRQGRRIVLEVADEQPPRISYDEFKRLVPAYAGPRVSIDAMRDLGAAFDDWKN